MKYVVIGSSAAGVNAIRELRRLDKERVSTPSGSCADLTRSVRSS